MAEQPQASLEHMAALLGESANYKVLRRVLGVPELLTPLAVLADSSPLQHALIVDTETTGLTDTAKIIQLAMIRFQYDKKDGRLYGPVSTYMGLEDPGEPLEPEISEITGLTDADVKGQHLDDAVIDEIIRDTDLVIAHNAGFDRPICERRMPQFAERPWACSDRDMPWKKLGVRSNALDYILARAAGRFMGEEHRADADCLAVLHILAARPNAHPIEHPTYLALLLEAARTPMLRVKAITTPYGSNTRLKARGYRAYYDGSQFRYWYKDVAPEAVAEEESWVTRDLGGEPPEIARITAYDRYSVRQ